tara:strand:- start:617 stop:835 length:219 start_codon:yes stop_codon:yes gene_type:complete
MEWDFSEDTTFKALQAAFLENEESSAMEFLVSDGADFYLELLQNAAGEGLDITDNEIISELQEEIINYLENN